MQSHAKNRNPIRSEISFDLIYIIALIIYHHALDHAKRKSQADWNNGRNANLKCFAKYKTNKET
jgi:hypothetical protein